VVWTRWAPPLRQGGAPDLLGLFGSLESVEPIAGVVVLQEGEVDSASA
jgi:hypothetical protein